MREYQLSAHIRWNTVVPTGLQTDQSSATQFLGREALEKLRSDVLDGVLEPGAKLPFALLQQQYGVSVGTIREALSHLVSERLVHLDAGRGFRVAPVSRADLLDISEMRIDFEHRALLDAMANGDDAWEVRIISSFHLLEKLSEQPATVRVRNPVPWTGFHRDFHAALVSGCRSRWLLQFRAQLFDQAERYRLLSLRHRPPSNARRSEHRAIMEAVLARDAKRACKLAEQHIRRTVEEVLRYAPQLR